MSESSKDSAGGAGEASALFSGEKDGRTHQSRLWGGDTLTRGPKCPVAGGPHSPYDARSTIERAGRASLF
jgi:hypothetical protein